MKVADVVKILENLAPGSHAEEFDNVGLLVGSLEENVENILITLDCIEEVVEEAVEKKCNMIVTFHPIIFSGLKSITGKNYVERALIKAIKNTISIYAIHTNLDVAKEGVNYEICRRLGVKNLRPLIAKRKCIKKLQTYIPVQNFKEVQQALFEAGAGEIGNYKNCSFRVEGKGTFLPMEGANPTLGRVGKPEEAEEVLLSVIFENYKETNILRALKNSHPYEEVAYEIYTLDNENQDLGMGRIGELETEMTEKDFLQMLKRSLPTNCIRHTAFLGKPIRKVAVLGGSGSFAIKDAIIAGADVFVTADIKYHEFFRAEGKVVLADIGHYESEQFTKNLLYNFLKDKVGNTPVMISEINTNPVNYYI